MLWHQTAFLAPGSVLLWDGLSEAVRKHINNNDDLLGKLFLKTVLDLQISGKGRAECPSARHVVSPRAGTCHPRGASPQPRNSHRHVNVDETPFIVTSSAFLLMPFICSRILPDVMSPLATLGCDSFLDFPCFGGFDCCKEDRSGIL